MVVLTGPSPKRRRTENGHVSDDQVRESNATLAIFMGQRHNRWMQNATTHRNGPSRNSDVTPRRSSGAQRTEGASADSTSLRAVSISLAIPDAEESAPSPTAELIGGGPERHSFSGAPTISAVLSTATPSSGLTAEAAIELVDYESPALAASPTMATTADMLARMNQRKSQDAQARTTGSQGLPSPAPSEDANSPLIVNAPNPIPQRNTWRDVAPIQRPKSRAAHVQAASTAACSPVMNTSPMLPSPPGPYPITAGQRGPSGPASPAARGSPVNSTHGFGPWPLQHHQNALPGTHNTLQNGSITSLPAQHQRRSSSAVQHQMVPSQPQLTMQPPQQRPHPVNASNDLVITGPLQLSLSNFFSTDEMLGRINQRFGRYESHPPSKQRDRNIGRLHLLNEAVRKHDWFYIVSNQLCCVQYTSGNQLPQLMLDMVPAEAYEKLAVLLCPNDALDADLVRFFSEFPAPLMRIYSGGHGQNQIYNMLTQQVAIFMQRLPGNYDRLENGCLAARTPPLVQDMMEQLALPSQVLQATIFRAVARRIWIDEPGIRAENGIDMLLRLHYADQEQQRANFRMRTPVEKQRMYHALQRAYAAWHSYEKRRFEINTRTVVPKRPLLPFVIPGDVLQIFGLPLQTPPPLASSPVTNGPNGVPWTIQQQQHQAAIELQQRDLQQQSLHGAPNARGAMLQAHHRDRILELQRQLAAQHARANQSLQPPLETQKLPTLLRPVFPHEKECPRPQPTQPDTIRHALHQAHLRSPVLAPARPQHSERQQMYRHVCMFAIAPEQLNKGRPIQTFKFDSNDMSKVPQTVKVRAGRYRRDLVEGSHEYRLRCAVFRPERGFPDVGSWVAADNVWPDGVYFEVNGVSLETRRKLHHGRYLPIDLTALVNAGSNELRVMINRTSKDSSAFNYAIAVELIRTISHDTLVNDIREHRTVSAQESLRGIKQTLNPTADDDDIVMAPSPVTIQLFDPISCAAIFITPVRSQYCKHRDPFDLELFLQTRRRKQQDWPTDVDVWKCPICRQDASPQHLMIDGWLVQVREELEKRDLLDTRAIVVEADGSWKPKEEERSGVRSPSMEREERAASAAGRRSKGPGEAAIHAPPKNAPVIIELD